MINQFVSLEDARRPDRTLAGGLQYSPSSQLARQSDTQRVRITKSEQPAFCGSDSLIANCSLTGPTSTQHTVKPYSRVCQLKWIPGESCSDSLTHVFEVGTSKDCLDMKLDRKLFCDSHD